MPMIRSTVALLLCSSASSWRVAQPRLQQIRTNPPQLVSMSASLLSDAAAAPGATALPSGLVYEEITAGTGASPSLDQMVKVDYTGTLADGSVFDSSVSRGVPAEFPLNKFIKGWQEGVAMMKEGGKAKLTIPAELAYGATERPGIPANSVLQFEIELLEVSGGVPIPDDYLRKSFGSFSMGKADPNAPPKDRTGQIIGLSACALIGLLSYAGVLPS